jgi:hypothetical protein
MEIAAGRLDARKSGHRLLIFPEAIESYKATLPRATLKS